jgi:DNA-binding PadR family transcriptional regulator
VTRGFELESITHGDSTTSSHLVTEVQSPQAVSLQNAVSRGISNGSERLPDILRLEMLSLLHLKPLTGYELRKNIKAAFNHEISFGTLYPNLASLERLGLILGRWVSLGENQLRRKRIFTLTDMGKSYLSDNLEKLSKLSATMQKMSLSAPPAN